MIIHNPASGLYDARRELERARAHLIARGWSVDLEHTRATGDAARLARAAAHARLDAVLIAGGDGTLNEAINALVGTETAVGLLPYGTANVWARQLGIPAALSRLLDAARLMDEACVRTVDVGRATVGLGSDREQTRYFLLWSGLGLDAYVTRLVEPRPASFRRWGIIGYSLAGLRAALAYRGTQAEIEIDGRHVTDRVVLVLVSNAELYAGFLHLAPGAQIDDGWLDVSVFRGEGFFASAGHVLRALLRRHVRDLPSTTVRGRHVRVTTTTPCDVHVDAEPIGASPAEFMIVPQALRVLVPPGAPDSLFTSSTPKV